MPVTNPDPLVSENQDPVVNSDPLVEAPHPSVSNTHPDTQSFASKAWQFANKPLVKLAPDINPDDLKGMGKVGRAITGVGLGLQHAYESATSPLSLGLLAGGGILAKAAPITARALAGGFAGLSAKQAADEAGELAKLPKDQRDAKTVAEHLTGMVANLGFAALAGHEALFSKKGAVIADKAGIPPEVHKTLEQTAKILPKSTAEFATTHIEQGAKSNEPENTKVEKGPEPIVPAADKIVQPEPEPGGTSIPPVAEAAKVSEGVNPDPIVAPNETQPAPPGVAPPVQETPPVASPEAKPAPETAGAGKAPKQQFESLDDIDASKLSPAQKVKARDAFLKSKGVSPPPEDAPPIVSMGGKAPADPGEISPANLALLGDSLKTLAEQSPKPNVKKAFDIGASLAPIKDGIADTLQGLRAVGTYLKTKLEGYPHFSKFSGLIGDRHLALSESALNARRFVKNATKALPDALTREAISNWVDNGGDETKLRAGLAATKDRYKPGYERALKLSPEEINIARNIQNYFEARLKDAQEAGILEDGIENYIHRYYEKDTSWKDGILAELRSGIFTGQPALAKQRIFEYDHEAEAAGYKPQKDFVKRVAAYDLALNKAIADRQLVKGMMQMKTPSGEPWVAVGGAANKIGGPATEGALLIKPTIKPKNVADYRAFDHPALRKWKWVAEDAEGKPIMVQGSVLIHPDALPQVKALFESSRIRQHPLGRAMLNLGSTVKQTMLDLSGFHQVQIGIHAAEHQRLQTRIGRMADIDLTHPDQRGLVRGGMVIGDTTGRQHFDEGLAGSSLSKHLPFGIGERVNQYKEWLFGDYIPKIKMTTGLMALERNKALFPNLSPDELHHLTANQMNAAFGELNYAMMGRSATMQDALRLALLSPDFTEARAGFVGQAFTKYGGRPHVENGKFKIGEQGKALLIGAGALYVLSRILNKLTSGEYHFEPANAFNVIYKGKAYSLRTVQGDILKAATEPSQFVRNRLNPVYGRTAMEVATGRDYFGRKRSAPQQAKDAAETVIPISARGLFSGREQSLSESMMNSLGITEHRDSAVQRVSQLADTWKEKNKVYGEPGEFIYDPDKDKFRDITLAARYADEAAVRSEILKAEQKGIPYSAITKHYNLSAKHLFTGSTKANEEKFKASLTADQRKQYQDAVKERNTIATKVRQSKPNMEPQ
jgi:hypothetical protein